MSQLPMENFLREAFKAAKEESKYSPFQQRVIEERKELVKKLDSLIAFMGTETFNGLDQEECYRLILQRDAMQSYACILQDRIFAFKAV